MIKKKELPEEDVKIWENYTKDPSDIYDKEKNNSSNISRKSRLKFDFHGFTLNKANTKMHCIYSKLYKKLP